MSNIKKIFITILVILSCSSLVLASNVNMNLANENTTATGNEASQNGTSENIASNTSNSGNQASSGTTNTTGNIVANIQSVNNINEANSASLEINQILNIFLIAIGLILILLAVAILIRLKR